MATFHNHFSLLGNWLSFPIKESTTVTAKQDPNMEPPYDCRASLLRGSPNSDQTSLTAVSKVLQTTELLEAILMMVSNRRQLLLMQRTSKSFHDSIKGSSRLQRRLFYSLASSTADIPLFNPMLKSISAANVQEAYDGTEATIAFRRIIFKVDNLKAVFKHNDTRWALTEVRHMQVRTDENFDGRDWRRDPNHSKEIIGWSLLRVAQNEKLLCPVFDLSMTSLRDMYIAQPSVSLSVVLYSGHPDAMVIAMDHTSERHNVSRNRCRPAWVVSGHAVAKFETVGNTVGDIFNEVDKVKWEYSQYGKGVERRDYVGCGCESCHSKRGPEERAARLEAIEIWKRREAAKPK